MKTFGGYGRYDDGHVGCPRAGSDMTPCVARDGHLAQADDDRGDPVSGPSAEGLSPDDMRWLTKAHAAECAEGAFAGEVWKVTGPGSASSSMSPAASVDVDPAREGITKEQDWAVRLDLIAANVADGRGLLVRLPSVVAALRALADEMRGTPVAAANRDRLIDRLSELLWLQDVSTKARVRALAGELAGYFITEVIRDPVPVLGDVAELRECLRWLAGYAAIPGDSAFDRRLKMASRAVDRIAALVSQARVGERERVARHLHALADVAASVGEDARAAGLRAAAETTRRLT